MNRLGVVSDHALMVLVGTVAVVVLAWATVVAGRYSRVNLVAVALTIVALTAVILTAVSSKPAVSTLLGSIAASAVGALAGSLVAAFGATHKPEQPEQPEQENPSELD